MSSDNRRHHDDEPCAAGCNDRRRTFCKACIGGMTAMSAAMVGFPIVSFMARPEKLGAGKPLEVPLDRLSVGQAHYVDAAGIQLIVLMAEEGPEVFNASCPHLGCNVIWDAGDGTFRCPCHGAIFTAGGQVVRGPVSAPLARVPFEIRDDKLVIG
jgi:Rieske Fe-S protein